MQLDCKKESAKEEMLSYWFLGHLGHKIFAFAQRRGSFTPIEAEAKAKKKTKQVMHSSRMRTARSLP